MFGTKTDLLSWELRKLHNVGLDIFLRNSVRVIKLRRMKHVDMKHKWRLLEMCAQLCSLEYVTNGFRRILCGSNMKTHVRK